MGLAFAVLLQLGQSVGNAPFNPARATASAVFSSSWSLEQLWLFWVAPLVGAAIAGLVFRGFAAGDGACRRRRLTLPTLTTNRRPPSADC